MMAYQPVQRSPSSRIPILRTSQHFRRNSSQLELLKQNFRRKVYRDTETDSRTESAPNREPPHISFVEEKRPSLPLVRSPNKRNGLPPARRRTVARCGPKMLAPISVKTENGILPRQDVVRTPNRRYSRQNDSFEIDSNKAALQDITPSSQLNGNLDKSSVTNDNMRMLPDKTPKPKARKGKPKWDPSTDVEIENRTPTPLFDKATPLSDKSSEGEAHKKTRFNSTPVIPPISRGGDVTPEKVNSNHMTPNANHVTPKPVAIKPKTRDPFKMKQNDASHQQNDALSQEDRAVVMEMIRKKEAELQQKIADEERRLHELEEEQEKVRKAEQKKRIEEQKKKRLAEEKKRRLMQLQAAGEPRLLAKASPNSVPSNPMVTSPPSASSASSAPSPPKLKRPSYSNNQNERVLPTQKPEGETIENVNNDNSAAAIYDTSIPGEQETQDVILVPCAHCGRKFKSDRLEKHINVCNKVSNSKRKVFDSTKKRAEGTDNAAYIRRGTHLMEHPTAKRKDWKTAHEEFQNIVKAARTGEVAPPTQNPDYVPCPHCNRTFNETAAERHIPRCGEQAKLKQQRGRGRGRGRRK